MQSSFSRYSHANGEIEDYVEDDYQKGKHQHVYLYYKSTYACKSMQMEQFTEITWYMENVRVGWDKIWKSHAVLSDVHSHRITYMYITIL